MLKIFWNIEIVEINDMDMEACWFLCLLLHYYIHTVCSDHLGVVILEHEAHPSLALSE